MSSLDQIRDQQQATWDKFSAGWKRWDTLVLNWLAPVGTELLNGAQLRANSYVLDIASGTGEPALSAAARCPEGKVMMTDLAEQMLAIAQENAARRGLRNGSAPVRRRRVAVRGQHIRCGHRALRVHVFPGRARLGP